MCIRDRRYGRPTDHDSDYGPLISQEHRDKVLGYYRKAVEEGATVVTGGGVPDMPAELQGGSWVQPTIWTGLADDATPVREEIFGPCCHLRPFDTEDEVVAPVSYTHLDVYKRQQQCHAAQHCADHCVL